MMKFKNSQLLTKILEPALEVWLHSQLDAVEGLQLEIASSDRELMGGIIPSLVLKSHFAKYHGLHFDQVALTAENIRVNVMQLFQGQPLTLLNPVPLFGKVRMTQAHLAASLNSSLLQSGLKDFLSQLLKSDVIPDLKWQEMILDQQQIILKGQRLTATPSPIFIQAEVTLKSPQKLLISPIQVEGFDCQKFPSSVEFDLGSNVSLEQLNVTETAIFIQGRVTIFPEETASNQGKITS